MLFHHDGCCYHRYFYGHPINFNNSFGFSVTSSFGSADTHLPEYVSPWTFSRILHWICYLRTSLSHVRFSSRIFYRGFLYFATDCPCGVWCRGFNACLVYVGPLFGNLVWNDIGFVSLTYWRKFFSLFDCVSTYILVPQNMIMLYMHLPYFQVSEKSFLYSAIVLFIHIDVVFILSMRAGSTSSCWLLHLGILAIRVTNASCQEIYWCRND